MTKLSGLERAMQAVGGKRTALAKAIGVSQPAISQALKRGGTMSPKSAIAIEKLTGGEVDRTEICPALAEIERDSQ